VDLCKLRGRHFLVVVDRFSGYPWVARLTTKTTGAVIAIMEKWFCEFGWPQRLGSDRGPQFRHEFEEWCSANNIIFEFPLQGTRLQTVLLKPRSSESNTSWRRSMGLHHFFVLLALRNTPMANGRVSPAQALFKQDLRVQGLPTVPASRR
jgi:hypothetical protein